MKLTGIISILQLFLRHSSQHINILTKYVTTEMKEKQISAEPSQVFFMKIEMQFRHQNCQDCNLTLVFKDK